MDKAIVSIFFFTNIVIESMSCATSSIHARIYFISHCITNFVLCNHIKPACKMYQEFQKCDWWNWISAGYTLNTGHAWLDVRGPCLSEVCLWWFVCPYDYRSDILSIHHSVYPSSVRWIMYDSVRLSGVIGVKRRTNWNRCGIMLLMPASVSDFETLPSLVN